MNYEEALGFLRGPWKAVLLFGSHARGDARSDSDIDILHVSPSPAPSYQQGAWSISVYTEPLLRSLASHGSLFSHHLITEARVVAGDPEILNRLSRRWAPRSPGEILEDVRAAAPLLDSQLALTMDFGPRLVSLSRFLLRTAAYARAQQKGESSYALERAADAADMTAFISMMRGRSSTAVDLAEIRTVLEDSLGLSTTNPHGSIEAFVVNEGFRRPFAAEMAHRLLSDEEVPYETTSASSLLFEDDAE